MAGNCNTLLKMCLKVLLDTYGYPQHVLMAPRTETKAQTLYIRNLEKNSKETHSNGSWNEIIPYLCLFCNSTFREKAI